MDMGHGIKTAYRLTCTGYQDCVSLTEFLKHTPPPIGAPWNYGVLGVPVSPSMPPYLSRTHHVMWWYSPLPISLQLVLLLHMLLIKLLGNIHVHYVLRVIHSMRIIGSSMWFVCYIRYNHLYILFVI